MGFAMIVMYNAQQRRQHEAAAEAVANYNTHEMAAYQNAYPPGQEQLPAYPVAAPAYSAAPPPGYEEATGAPSPPNEAPPPADSVHGI